MLAMTIEQFKNLLKLSRMDSNNSRFCEFVSVIGMKVENDCIHFKNGDFKIT